MVKRARKGWRGYCGKNQRSRSAPRAPLSTCEVCLPLEHKIKAADRLVGALPSPVTIDFWLRSIRADGDPPMISLYADSTYPACIAVLVWLAWRFLCRSG